MSDMPLLGPANDAPEQVGLGEQPYSVPIQSEAEHFDQREVAKQTAIIALQKVLEVAQVELANLPYSAFSKALGNTRSHLAYVIGQTEHVLTNLPR